MVILHVAIKQFIMGFLCIFQRTKTCFFKKKTKNGLKKQVGVFFKKLVFLNLDYYLSILFYDFPLIARSGTSDVTINLIGYAPHTWSIGPWY